MSVKEWITSRLDADPIILAHHPLCGRFDDHMFIIGNRKVCIGCFTVYPSALAALVVLAVMGAGGYRDLMVLALAMFGANLLRFVPWGGHRASWAFNVLLGISLAAVILAVVRAPGERRMILALMVLAVASVFVFVKGMRVFLKCRGCGEYPSFPKCRAASTDQVRQTGGKN